MVPVLARHVAWRAGVGQWVVVLQTDVVPVKNVPQAGVLGQAWRVFGQSVIARATSRVARSPQHARVPV